MPLLGRCAACAGRLSRGRFVRLLAVSLQAFRPDLREHGREHAVEIASRFSPEMVRKCSPEDPKWLQNHSRRPPGTLPKSPTESGDLFLLLFLCLLGGPWAPPGGLWDRLGTSGAAPVALLGSILAFRVAVFGVFSSPFSGTVEKSRKALKKQRFP